MTGHTPGPWRVGFSDGSGAGESYGAEGIYITGPDGQVVVWGGEHFGHISGVERSADAQLIAAAPDLLQALEQILGWQKLRRGLGEIPIERIEQIAEAAIGKAKGTTVGP